MPPRMPKQKPAAKPRARSERANERHAQDRYGEIPAKGMHHLPQAPAPINPQTLTMRPVQPKNQRQEILLGSMAANALTFISGPAGTGKTYLVMAAALEALITGKVTRIVVTRPAVTVAGEEHGFLPGDLNAKMDPFVRPMLDALKDMIPTPAVEALLEQKVIEILPFAYMRGCSLKNTFIFLDECQNATADQMKTALTRIAEGSVCVVACDPQQIDLPGKAASFVHDMGRFENVKGIGTVAFLPQDILRSRIVRIVLNCYPAPE